MKTHANQILTIVSFFTMSLTTTLVISWGMTGIIGSSYQGEICPSQTVQIIHKKINISSNLNKTVKMLLPNSIVKMSR